MTSTTPFIDAVYWQVREWSEIETIRWDPVLLKDGRNMLALEPKEPQIMIHLKVEN